MLYTFYELIYSQYSTVITAASNTAANQILGAIGPYLTAALSLLIIVLGCMMMVQRLHVGDGVLWIVRALAIANLLTVGNYNTFVMTPFLTTIPAAIASITGSANGSPANVAVIFDQLQGSVEKLTANLDAAADNAGLFGIGDHIKITIAYYFTTWTLMVGFGVALVGAIFANIIAPAGAVLLIFYLFRNTRHIAERWIGIMVSLMLLQLLVMILMGMIITEFQTMTNQQDSNGVLADIAENISFLWNIGLNFFVGIMLLIGIPVIATVIGGGPVSAMVSSGAAAVSKIASAGNTINRL